MVTLVLVDDHVVVVHVVVIVDVVVDAHDGINAFPGFLQRYIILI
jgi:hypothetical protein